MKECRIPGKLLAAGEWATIVTTLIEASIDIDKPYEMTHDIDTLSNIYRQKEENNASI